MAKLLIVDGHSVILGSQRRREDHTHNARRARHHLITELNAYQGATDHSVVVVFDGKGREENREGGSEGEALVIYSRAGSSADAVIERLVARQAPRRRVAVASNDRLVLEAAMASGAEAISIRSLEEDLARQTDAFRDRWRLG